MATELHAALQSHHGVTLHTLALRSSWKWIHVKSVPFLLFLAFRLKREARAHRVEAILFTSMTTALPLLVAGRALRSRGIRLAAIAHGLDVTDPNPAYQMAIRRLCGSLDAVMPISRATAGELVARGLSPDKVHVVPNGVDLDRFAGVFADRGRPSQVEITGAPVLPDDAFLMVAVGRQVRRKGFAWFIEKVMPKLPSRTVLWLAGDGPERDRIEASIRHANVGTRVFRLGRISEAELVELYRKGDLLVMPNLAIPGDMEGFGIVMLEAGACGLPTLAADLEGIRDVVQEGVNGWLVASGDAEAFADRIGSLLDDPERLRAASRRTVEHVTSTFRWDRTVERYLEILRAEG